MVVEAPLSQSLADCDSSDTITNNLEYTKINAKWIWYHSENVARYTIKIIWDVWDFGTLYQHHLNTEITLYLTGADTISTTCYLCIVLHIGLISSVSYFCACNLLNIIYWKQHFQHIVSQIHTIVTLVTLVTHDTSHILL